MKVEAAKFVEDLVWDLEVMEDYSGRGMYGRTTAGLVFERGMEHTFKKAILKAIKADEVPEDLIEDLEKILIDDYRQDSMGRGIIIY